MAACRSGLPIVAGGILVATALVLVGGVGSAARSPGLISCRSTPGASCRTITVGPSANGRTIRAHIGDTLVVRLPGNPTTGYRWMLRNPPSVLHLFSASYVPSAPGRLGQGGTFVFRFTVRHGPAGKLAAAYRRPWEKGKPPLRTFSLAVRVP